MATTPTPKLQLDFVVVTRIPEPDGNFLVYRPHMETFHLSTDLETYPDDLRDFLDAILVYVNVELAAVHEPELRYSIRLENVTAQPSGAGTWVQAKHHIDRHLTAGDLSGLSASPTLATPVYLKYPHHSYLEDYILGDIDVCKDFANYSSSFDE